ncbi:septal ring lytic transglycosylase RlpA family protein [Lysobacter sp. D1-1-M9]|uniref:septal ring lytic transglycosylase RlpA family protein n=1 Tax=Novilysobacter longmucuonensis TaxID=3098603 RepID=UPI002FC65DCB
MRWPLAAALVLGLAACAGTPEKPPAPAAPQVERETAGAGTPVSPYAPAKEDPSTRGDYVAGGLYKPGVPDSTPEHVPDVDRIPEPEVVELPRSRVGNRARYSVLGKTYRVMDDARGYVEQGEASYYGKKFHGRRTSNMEVYDMYAFTAAHKSLPLPSFARVTNLDNGKSVVVRVNDRGPFHEGRVIDLSYAAAVKLDYVRNGTARVEVRALTPGDPATSMHAAASPTDSVAPAPGPGVQPPASAMDHLVETIPVGSAAAVELPPGVRIATGQPSPMPAQTAAPVMASGPAPSALTLQVAAFSTRRNAERALAMMREAGIDGARLLAGDADGRPVWRLRISPVATAAAPDLAARIVELGFGQPQHVHD